MKNLRFSAVSTALILFATFTFAEIRTSPLQEVVNPSGQKVRATLYQGNLIPVANLSEVEIVDSAPASQMLPATYQNGELTIMATLPEVEITASNAANHRVPVTNYNGQPVATVFLPVVEISEDLPTDKLVAVTFVNGAPVALVSLEEVEISAGKTAQTSGQAIAEWNVNVQSNPAILVGHTSAGEYYLMSYQGTYSDNTENEVFVYKLISRVRGAVTEGLGEILRSFSVN
jgi:hypothetical protein